MTSESSSGCVPRVPTTRTTSGLYGWIYFCAASGVSARSTSECWLVYGVCAFYVERIARARPSLSHGARKVWKECCSLWTPSSECFAIPSETFLTCCAGTMAHRLVMIQNTDVPTGG